MQLASQGVATSALSGLAVHSVREKAVQGSLQLSSEALSVLASAALGLSARRRVTAEPRYARPVTIGRVGAAMPSLPRTKKL